jgi:hypothetical protein
MNTLQKELPVVCPRAHSALTSVPGSRDAPYRKTNLRFRHLKSLPHKSTKFLSIYRYSLAISALGNQYATRKLQWLIMLWIVSLMPSIAAPAAPPCLVATVRVSSNFGALRERCYKERILFQILKTLREENKEVRELRRARRVTQNTTYFSFRI